MRNFNNDYVHLLMSEFIQIANSFSLEFHLILFLLKGKERGNMIFQWTIMLLYAQFNDIERSRDHFCVSNIRHAYL